MTYALIGLNLVTSLWLTLDKFSFISWVILISSYSPLLLIHIVLQCVIVHTVFQSVFTLWHKSLHFFLHNLCVLKYHNLQFPHSGTHLESLEHTLWFIPIRCVHPCRNRLDALGRKVDDLTFLDPTEDKCDYVELDRCSELEIKEHWPFQLFSWT